MPKSVNTNEYDHFRLLLVNARKDAGMTQAELARAVDRPQSFVSKYERGERRLDVIEFLQIANGLKLEVGSFLENLMTKGDKADGRLIK